MELKTQLDVTEVRELLSAMLEAKRTGSKKPVAACWEKAMEKGYSVSIRDMAFLTMLMDDEDSRSVEWEKQLRTQRDNQRWRLQA